MKKLRFYIVDVFAEKKYAGNQLAVIRDAQNLPGETMQQIAREMNFSETTFILSEQMQDGAFPVRIFTPAREVPFAGHPTLGTAFVIHREIAGPAAAEIRLKLKAGEIPVRFETSEEGLPELWMTQLAPQFGAIHSAKDLGRILQLDPAEIDDRFPIQEVSTGLPFIMVPLRSLGAVRKARLEQAAYRAFIENTVAKMIFIFAPETYHSQNHLNGRLFADYYGVAEDPATGSANGCLAGYLVYHRYWGKPEVNVRVEQGYEIGRPSLLLLKAREKKDQIEIQVGGKVIPVAQGELL